MYKKAAIAVLVICGFIFGGAVCTKSSDLCQKKPDTVVKIEQARVLGLDETYLPGEIISLRVQEAEPQPNFVRVNYQWFVLDRDGNLKTNTIVFPGGESVFFGAGITSPNKFTIILVANYLLPKDELVTKVYTGKVYVGNKPGPVPPDPVPVPTPDPTFPDGKYKLAAFVYNLTRQAVNDPNKVAVAKALAESYNTVASAISAGAYRDIQTILTKTTEANKEAMLKAGADRSSWDAVRSKIVDHIYELYKSGAIRTPEDFATAWRELAEGLNGIK